MHIITIDSHAIMMYYLYSYILFIHLAISNLSFLFLLVYIIWFMGVYISYSVGTTIEFRILNIMSLSCMISLITRTLEYVRVAYAWELRKRRLFVLIVDMMLVRPNKSFYFLSLYKLSFFCIFYLNNYFLCVRPIIRIGKFVF